MSESTTRRPRSGRDRGMQAVARVREVRERDSRAGLMQALANVRARESHLAELEQTLAAATHAPNATLNEFMVNRQFLAASAIRVREAARRLEEGRIVATEAHSRWQADKARMRAIEQLLERRALRRLEERNRAEAREIDDLVGRRPGRHQEKDPR